MRKIRLTRQEMAIEDSLLRGEYVSAPKGEFEDMAEAIAARRRNAVLNIRVNSRDLASIKQKAQKLGIKYQTLISEIIHRVAQAN